MTVLEPIIEFLQGYCRKKITLGQLLSGVERPRKPILRVMDRLVKEGNLEEIEDNKIAPVFGECGRNRRNPTWLIIEKPLMDEFVPRPSRTTLRDKMWRLIRSRRRFSKRDLMRFTGCKEGSATDYTKLLEHYGYIRTTGKDGHLKVYMLIKDPGPKRPVTPEVKKRNVK
jgi:hypothetical protein